MIAEIKDGKIKKLVIGRHRFKGLPVPSGMASDMIEIMLNRDERAYKAREFSIPSNPEEPFHIFEVFAGNGTLSMPYFETPIFLKRIA